MKTPHQTFLAQIGAGLHRPGAHSHLKRRITLSLLAAGTFAVSFSPTMTALHAVALDLSPTVIRPYISSPQVPPGAVIIANL